MTWLHTWAGLVLGAVLFAVFWMGTLSVFHEELDRWMQPATRLPPPPAVISLDRLVVPLAATEAVGASQWGLMLPTAREPMAQFFYRAPDGGFVVHAIDPHTGALLPEPGSAGATGFIVPFHYGLHIEWRRLGYWLVGAASMGMLVLLVSGVVVHRRRFKEFFTFRPDKRLPRATLDLHNLTGMVALPFHFLITLTGVILFMEVYFPSAADLAYRSADNPRGSFFADAFGGFRRPLLNESGELVSLDAMVVEASARWSGSPPRFVRVWHPGDANAYVEVRRTYADQASLTRGQIFFDAGSGRILHQFDTAPVMSTQRFLSGLHFIAFDHWALRWLYFLAGLAGCAMIATGFVFWLEARRRRHAGTAMGGRRLVEALTVASVTGIIAATLALLVANRLLPADASMGSTGRSELEVWVFWAVWLVAFAHASLRGTRAWRDQTWAIGGLAFTAVLLNGLTTGHHPLAALQAQLWAVAGVDAVLLMTGAAALAVAIRLGRRGTPHTLGVDGNG
ncbi:peptidase [Alkalilimnicola ehrlichii]|uniref:Peptidase n=1 Tax=Alkalilimnicola ehrlichii TaxID=351052 RepID=A0A3E0WNS3_9GAMM|nr:PepSY-associated TM helix domain-containing protein [Alkalilimnicola ehrlichii]RFA27818.1 peptidase [Alkalilimnicola ehrlichii]RFA33605.1 peptidase [Alkalilimnicola ehrlichii]